MMAFERKSFEDICESVLAQITKGIVREKHTYEPYQFRYSLVNTPVKSIVRVEGVSDGAVTSFADGDDYQLSDDTLEWLPGGARPDERTVFHVNYSIGERLPLTDVNSGSVIRTIAEAVSREIDFLYAQLNHVYDAGFIDTATGSALDLVASILGVERKSAEPAMGEVTFGRNTPPGEIGVDHEAHLQDGRGSYVLNSGPVKEITKIEGSLSGAPHEFARGVDYALEEGFVNWLPEGSAPDPNTTFYVDYIIYERVVIPVGSRVSTYARRSEDAKVFEVVEERVLGPTPEGRWEARVPVKAVEPGSSGNVFAGTVVVMPQPLVGVEYVLNRGDILTGVDVETDDDLRERARRALEVAGKATLASLESAIKGIEGVTSVLIEDMPDDVPGVVRVIVQGGVTRDIEEVIEDIRAAGIKVELERPRIVNIDVDVTVSLERGAVPSSVEREVEARIRTYLSSLDISDDVIFNRIINRTLNIDGVYDIEVLTIEANREGGEEPIRSERENIALRPEEMALPREINVLVRVRDVRGG